uniref:Peptidase A1 domain-containing protein n=1 Tax=Glycine max TaxID=3847 RepID=A0A0R0EFQ6_SOYBN
MDPRGVLILVAVLVAEIGSVANGNLVFPVERRKRSLSAVRAHDVRRRGRILSAVDLNLGGNGLPTETGFSEIPCPYSITYGDGSATTGYYVQDYLTYNRINGNLRTSPQNSSIIFGCGAVQSGTLGSSSEEALDGIIGFGQANSSVLSQLAASGKVKKIFSHCLDNVRGGGIFAIGEVVEPKVSTTPLVPRMAHYNVVLKSIEVDTDILQLPSDIFDSVNGKGTVIDSGTTLAYLPAIVYDELIQKVLARQPGLKLYLVEQQFRCFLYTGNVDRGFPVVKLHFKDSLSLTVYPHDYLFQFKDGIWCIGWQRSVAQTKNGKDMTLLGDLVLSNKLVIYDLENMVIGWTDYNSLWCCVF